jgi:hypothetical protein
MASSHSGRDDAEAQREVQRGLQHLGKAHADTRLTIVCANLMERASSLMFVGGGEGVMLSEEQDERAMDLNDPRKRLFLYAYARTGTLAAASEAMSVKGRPLVPYGTHVEWKDKDPTYRRLFEEIDGAVAAVWERRFEEKALQGLEERNYDAGGTLTHKRTREDAGMLRAVMAAKIPSRYRDVKGGGGGGTNITVIVERTNE